MYIRPISERCDLDEINLTQGTIANAAGIEVAGKYLKQEYTENGKPWYKHESKASRHFYDLTTIL